MLRSPRARLRLLLAVAGGALLVGLPTSPASATVTGGCQGGGTIDGTRHDAAALDPARPITIPDQADVAYDGSIPLTAGTTDRAYSGKVDLQLPLGGSVTVADWGGSSKEVAANGVYHYSIPSFVPRGVTVRAAAVHNHAELPASCIGAFSIQLEGGPLDSPLPTGAAVGGTIISGAVLAKAASAKRGMS